MKLTQTFLTLLALCCGSVLLAQPAAFDFPAGCTVPNPLSNNGAEFFVTAQVDGVDADVNGDWLAVANGNGDIVGRVAVSQVVRNNVFLIGGNIILRTAPGNANCPTVGDAPNLTVLLSDASNNDAILTAPNSNFQGTITTSGSDNFVDGPDNDPAQADQFNFLTSSLPVTLTDFTATPATGKVNLNWATSEELDNDYFDVQRSTNPEDGFISLGKVRGNETTSDESTYAFTDHAPATGTNYYRLEQVDFDGTATYSPVVIADVAVAPELGMAVFPNPAAANGRLTVNLTGAWATGTSLRLVSTTGRLVREWTDLAAGSLNTDLPAVKSGVYQLVATNGKETRTTRVVVR